MTVCLEIRFEEHLSLSPADRKAVESLIADCRVYDGIDPSLHFDTHLNADGDLPAWRLAWAEPSGGVPLTGTQQGRFPCVLAGAACAFAPGRQEGEISACVAPVFRRHGIFRRLYRGLAADLVAAGASTVLLVCEAASPSGAAVAARLGANLDRSEYLMKISAERLARIRAPEGLSLVPVTLAESDETAELTTVIFGDAPDDARAFTMAKLADPGREQYIARAAEGPAGLASLAHDEAGYWIHGLGVLPALRNRGYGGAILDAVLVVLARRGADSVKLEVEAGNTAAIALYRSRGFEDETRIDYWRIGDPGLDGSDGLVRNRGSDGFSV